MADTPGSPLGASPGESDDSAMPSLGLGCSDFPAADPRPGFLSELGESRGTLRLSFIPSTKPDTTVTDQEYGGMEGGTWGPGLQVAGKRERSRLAMGVGCVGHVKSFMYGVPATCQALCQALCKPNLCPNRVPTGCHFSHL